MTCDLASSKDRAYPNEAKDIREPLDLSSVAIFAFLQEEPKTNRADPQYLQEPSGVRMVSMQGCRFIVFHPSLSMPKSISNSSSGKVDQGDFTAFVGLG